MSFFKQLCQRLGYCSLSLDEATIIACERKKPFKLIDVVWSRPFLNANYLLLVHLHALGRDDMAKVLYL